MANEGVDKGNYYTAWIQRIGLAGNYEYVGKDYNPNYTAFQVEKIVELGMRDRTDFIQVENDNRGYPRWVLIR